MKESNRTCQICGKPYYACRKCEEINSPRQTTDRNECYAFYVTLTALRQNVISKGEAKDKLEQLGVNSSNIKSKRNKFLPEIYDWIEKIVSTEDGKNRVRTKNK